MDVTGIGSVAEAVTTIANKLFPDKTQAERDQAALVIQEVADQYKLQAGQIEINKVEAASTNWFIAGWRPFIGWVCGFALVYQYIVFPLCSKWLEIVPLDTQTLVTLLLALLGMGGMRTFEKYSNTEGNR